MPEHENHSKRVPLSDRHVLLGAELRRIRKAADKTVAQMGFAKGHISSVENGYEKVTMPVLNAYIALGGDPIKLLDMFDACAKALGEETKAGGELFDFAALGPDASPYILRRGYRINLLDDYYRIGADRRFLEMMQVVRVYPLADGVRYYPSTRGSGPDKRRHVLTLKPSSACKVAHLEEAATGALAFVLDFTVEPPRDDGSYEFSYAFDINTPVPITSPVRGYFRTAVGRCVTRLQFTPPMFPAQVWWFREQAVLATETGPKSGQLLPPSSTGYYFKEFDNIEDEFCGLGVDRHSA